MPASSSKGHKLPFFPEFKQKLPVQPGQSSSLPACLLAHRDGLLLCFGDFIHKVCLAFLNPFIIKDSFPRESLYQCPGLMNWLKSTLQKSKLEVLLTHFLTSSVISRSLCPQWPLTTISPISCPSLFVNSSTPGRLIYHLFQGVLFHTEGTSYTAPSLLY